MIGGSRSGRLGFGALAAVTLVAGSFTPGLAYPRPGQTEVVSVQEDGTAAGWTAGLLTPAMTGDGRFVAFWGFFAHDPRDTEFLTADLYVRDRGTGTTTWASSGPGWAPLNHLSVGGPSISGDGRYVAFISNAPVVPDDMDARTDVFVRDLVTETTELASTDPAELNFSDPQISSDGRYVAFTGSSPQTTQVYLADRESGTTEVVSLGSNGQPLPGVSLSPSISGDSRYVAFSNQATPTPRAPRDVYVRDRVGGTTEQVTKGREPSISDDGRSVAFLSPDTDLVARDMNLADDVFVRDRETGTTERVSVSSAGAEAEGTMGPPLGGAVFPQGPSPACVGADNLITADAPASSSFASISGDGRYVSFVSLSGNLVPGDTNQCHDVFVHDRALRTTERISVSSNGEQAVRAGFVPSAPTPGGRYVAFEHYSDLEANDTNRNSDVYVRDRGPEVGVGHLEAAVAGGQVWLSGSTAFSGAALSGASDPEGDAGVGGALGADLTGAGLVYRHEQKDLLVRLSLAGIAPTGMTPVSYGMRFAVGPTTYEARIDTAGATLHRCTPGCTQTATLEGSIGTTGNEVLIAVPLSALEASSGSHVTGVRAFTTLGVDADQIALPDAEIPAATVTLGLAPAGTPQSQVDFTTPAALTDGSFSGALDTSGLEPGEYDVWARACLGDACGSDSVLLTLPSGL